MAQPSSAGFRLRLSGWSLHLPRLKTLGLRIGQASPREIDVFRIRRGTDELPTRQGNGFSYLRHLNAHVRPPTNASMVSSRFTTKATPDATAAHGENKQPRGLRSLRPEDERLVVSACGGSTALSTFRRTSWMNFWDGPEKTHRKTFWTRTAHGASVEEYALLSSGSCRHRVERNCVVIRTGSIPEPPTDSMRQRFQNTP